LITAALSVYAAIMSLYPKQRRKKSLDLLHFSDIAKLTESRYRERLKEIFNDYDKLSEAAVKDIYHLSKYILQPKFVWIKASYLIFIVGYIITLAVVVYTKLHL
ncbi:hypothetical protein HON22_04275, partial [Candidatus Peregrinibacteria bacterium]|nr:hypothetical protein [Candidatus Peregrinibacteria bacterium]